MPQHQPPRQPLPEIKPLPRWLGGILITLAIVSVLVTAYLAAYFVGEYGKDQSVVNQVQTPPPVSPDASNQ
ncbi:MAG: hypothetical protein AAF730_18460 [Bacteroidota bacterium]